MSSDRTGLCLDSNLVSAIFAALDIACDNGDLEVAARLSDLAARLALREHVCRRPRG